MREDHDNAGIDSEHGVKSMHTDGDKCNASNRMAEAEAERKEGTSSTRDRESDTNVADEGVPPPLEGTADRDSVRRVEAFEEVDKRLQEIEDREKEGNQGRQALMDSIAGVLDVLGSTRECLSDLGHQQRNRQEGGESMAEILREQLVEALKCRDATSGALQNFRRVQEEMIPSGGWETERIKEIEEQCEALQTECNVLKGKLVRAQVLVDTLQRRLLHRTMGFAILLVGVVLGISNLGV